MDAIYIDSSYQAYHQMLFDLHQPVELAPFIQVELCPPNKKKTNMCYDSDFDPKICYLNERIETIAWQKCESLRRQFGLIDGAPPSTASEAVERIKAGKYVLPSQDMIDTGVRSIIWRDPSVVKDKAGYDVAFEAKINAKIAARDVVMTGTPAEGLKAVQDFEAWTYTAPATTASV
jgi:hypothetical protein